MIEVKPTTLKQANAYVEAVHRHHGRVVGHKWSLAAFKDGRLCGVAIVGRPTGRRLDDGNTLEVTRLCTDGTRNACSALYAACARRAKREGYGKIITFTLQSEPGTSLKAAGWTLEAEKRDEDPQDAGSVIIRVPAFRAMARCNEHLNHGPISIEVDGRIIIDLAKRLKENPGSRLEIGG